MLRNRVWVDEAESPQQERGKGQPEDRLLEYPHDELKLRPSDRAKRAAERHRPWPARRRFSAGCSFHCGKGVGNATKTPGARHSGPPTSAPQAWFS
jgi:hypothetical protein